MTRTQSDRFQTTVLLFSLVVAIIGQSLGSSASAALIPTLPPPSVLPGALESQLNGYIFLESLTVLAAPLTVDINAPGIYNSNAPGTPGTIAAGVPVLSYMVHHEAVNSQLSSIAGSFVFPHPILGVIYTDANLDLTDPTLGHTGTSYPTGLGFRGFDLTYPTLPDTIIWSGNTLTIQSNAMFVMDQLRVIVAIPEPNTLALGALGGLALFAFGRRRAFVRR